MNTCNFLRFLKNTYDGYTLICKYRFFSDVVDTTLIIKVVKNIISCVSGKTTAISRSWHFTELSSKLSFAKHLLQIQSRNH